MEKSNFSPVKQFYCLQNLMRKTLIRISILLMIVLMPAQVFPQSETTSTISNDNYSVGETVGTEDNNKSVAPDLEIFCADNVTIPSCNTQEDVDAAFAAWLEGFYYAGGCDVTEEGLDVSAPDNCGGSVTVVYIVYDDCDQYETCTATFTVDPAPELTITCPDDMTIPSCSSQDDVNAEFAAWLEGFGYDGGCEAYGSGNVGDAPSYCGGSITIDYYAYDNCDQSVSCSATFTVDPAPELTIVCADDMTIPSCNTQDDVNAAFGAWLEGFGYTGGCDVTEEGLEVSAPDNCGGSVSVIYIVYDDCDQYETCTATFTVDPAPELTITCPEDVLLPSCTSQELVDAAYGAWLEGFTYNGGCNVTASGFDGLAPSYCGGTVTRDYSVYDDCDQTASCSSTFMVEPAPAIEISCPDDMIMNSCPTQDEVDTAFANWLDEFGFDGGCGATGYGNIGDAPPYCGGTVTIDYVVVDNCDQSAECSATFSVDPAEELIITCPDDVDLECPTEEELEAAYDEWFNGFSYTGGCNVTESKVELIPDRSVSVEVVIIIEYTVYDECGQSETCTSTFRYTVCGSITHCTFTQGYYGNSGGTDCNGKSTSEILDELLGMGDLIIGCEDGSNSLILSDGDCIIERLPGGGSSLPLYVDGTTDCFESEGIPLNNSGRWKNNLLSQSITLGLNLRYDNTLGEFELLGTGFTTSASDDCIDGNPIPDTEESFSIPASVMSYLNSIASPPTVDDLWILANSALCDDDYSGPSTSDINEAVDAINRGFDECRILSHYDGTDDISYESSVTGLNLMPLEVEMSAYPNPSIQDKVTITFKVPVTTHARLEVYNVTGERMGILYDAIAPENTIIQSTLDASELTPGMYFYRLNVESDQVKPVTISKLIITK